MTHNFLKSRECKLEDRKTGKCKECDNAYLVLAFVVIVIFVYYLYKTLHFSNDVPNNDPFNKKLFELSIFDNCCSAWPVSHFILFLILGFFFPHCWWIFIILGVVWEVLETILSYVFKNKNFRAMKTSEGKLEYSKNWWAGSFKDIIFNSAGIMIGVGLAQAFA